MAKRSAATARTTVRCAIYTRKSTEEGLEQEFNSLDAQREACEAYIVSQRHEGWTLVRDAYDDGGFSGGNMERPGMKRLLADIEAGKVDVIWVMMFRTASLSPTRPKPNSSSTSCSAIWFCPRSRRWRLS